MSIRDATDRLTAFFTAMKEWEQACSVRESAASDGELPWDEHNARGLAALGTVFTEHCMSGTPERGAAYRQPPEYDPEKMEIQATQVIDEDHVDIVVKHLHALSAVFRYRVTRAPDRWRVERRWHISRNGTETATVL